VRTLVSPAPGARALVLPTTPMVAIGPKTSAASATPVGLAGAVIDAKNRADWPWSTRWSRGCQSTRPSRTSWTGDRGSAEMGGRERKGHRQAGALPRDRPDSPKAYATPSRVWPPPASSRRPRGMRSFLEKAACVEYPVLSREARARSPARLSGAFRVKEVPPGPAPDRGDSQGAGPSPDPAAMIAVTGEA